MTFVFCTTFALTNLTIYADSFIGNKDCGYSSFCLFMGRYVREERTYFSFSKNTCLSLLFCPFFISFAIKINPFSSDSMKRLQLLILWVWMVCFSAASHNYMFKHLEVKDGLSNNQVNAIYKDSNGFMWFGTASGLNRYDGYDMRIYRSQKDDEKSLPDSYIEDIQEDMSGNLWIRTVAGYAIYNSVSDVFDCNVEAWMWNIGITGSPSLIYIDKEKSFWIYVNGKGIYKYKDGQKSAVIVKGSDELIVEAEVSDMKECDEGILLVLNNGVLACIDKEKQSFRWVNYDITEDRKEMKNALFDLFVDRSGRVWIFSVEGMWIYSLSRKAWEQRSPRTDTYNTVRAIAQDKYGCIWVGRDQDGIELIEPAGLKIHLANDPNNGSL